MFNYILNWFRNRQRFVILDCADSSVTLSRCLFRHIRRHHDPDAKPRIFVFRIPRNGCYAFIVNPDIETETQFADLQYNSRHRCIGFETLNPTVARILYDYAIPDYTRPCRLTVTTHTLNQTQTYYQIERPNEKSSR